MNIIKRKITKIGNSVGITLLAYLLKSVGLSQGDVVQIEVKDGKIISCSYIHTVYGLKG